MAPPAKQPGPSGARRTQSRGQATREKLLRVARELFGRDGYEGTSIGEVARLAGVGVGTLYHHFADKRELLLELLDRESGETSADLMGERGGPLAKALRAPDFRASLIESLRLIRKLRFKYPAVYMIAVDLARRDPEVAERCRAHEERYAELTRVDVRIGLELGRIRKGIDPETAAVTICRSFEAVLRDLITTEGEEEDARAEILMAELADMMARYLLVDD